MKKNIQTYFMMALLISVVGLLGFIVLKPEISQRTALNATGVVEKVKSISELNTVEMYFNEIIDYKNAKKFNQYDIPFTEKSFIFTVKAKVKAGIDLSALTEDDVKIIGDAITITLPEPQITSKEILSYKAYDEKDGLFNEITNEDTLMALEEFTKNLDQQALENGLLEEADERTQQVLRNILKIMGFEVVDFK